MLTRPTWLATSTPLPRAWRYKPPGAPAANNSTASSTSPYAPGQPDTDRPRATRCLKGSMSQGPEAVDSHGAVSPYLSARTSSPRRHMRECADAQESLNRDH